MTDWEIPISATGLLQRFAAARMIALPDYHLARTLAYQFNEHRKEALLAFALVTREVRLGSVCLNLAAATSLLPEYDGETMPTGQPELPWPDLTSWLGILASSPAVAGPAGPSRPFRLADSLLYLGRFWDEEQRLLQRFATRATQPNLPIDPAALQRAQPPAHFSPDPNQDAAVEAVLSQQSVVITGGPGTGKSTTVARVVQALAGGNSPARIALAAPTGKAVARLAAALAETDPQAGLLPAQIATLHSLIGMRPGSDQRSYNLENPLPYDAVIVDETSMVSLSVMVALLEAVAADTRLVLIGDPYQLSSVTAGSVLADIAAGGLGETGPKIVELTHNRRSNNDITALATAIRHGDLTAAKAALADSDSCSLVAFDGTQSLTAYPELAEIIGHTAERVLTAAAAGQGAAALAALEDHRLLCGHRDGPFGVSHFTRETRRYLSRRLPRLALRQRHYVGQPLLVTRNSTHAKNGDTAVITNEADQLWAYVGGADQPRRLPLAALESTAELYAMTIHKSQGSQYDQVTVVLPPLGSPLLTRELVYTAVTRAKRQVRLLGSLAQLSAAIATPTRRASGIDHYRTAAIEAAT
ncbi:MAG: exodeoxyribonuclease V subunit alpha [Arachnia propionica]|nr:MAG: exodeoxyribonuclease V subunit alpha [Arachnia propionica]